jgi:hypothetical protein
MSFAVKLNDGSIDIVTHSGGWNMSAEDFETIKEAFEDGILLNNSVIRPSAVIGYLNETNPKLLETEIEIEKNKIRRKMQNQAYDLMKMALPFAVILITAVIAFKMLDSGSVSTVAQTAANAASTTAPVTIR